MLKLVPEVGNEGKADVKNYHVLRKSSCFSKPLASTCFLLLASIGSIVLFVR